MNPRAILAAVAACVLASCGGSVEQASPAGPDQRPSCRARAPGADGRCALDGNVDCCAWSHISGGTYNRLNDPKLPATVSSFKLDLFEVTIGRFRTFLEAYPGSRPRPGDGANPHIGGSGWKSEWDSNLPVAKAEFLKRLEADLFSRACTGWSNAPGAHEAVPMPCLSWYEAFAFCAWDHGRLPTQAEWNYAAAGGTEQRTNPWGNEPYDPSRALNFQSSDDASGGALVAVGSRPAGKARWGQYDMGGSRNEILLDSVDLDHVSEMPTPCSDCAELDGTLNGRVIRDLNYHNAPLSVVEKVTQSHTPDVWNEAIGVRCVYSP